LIVPTISLAGANASTRRTSTESLAIAHQRPLIGDEVGDQLVVQRLEPVARDR